MRKPHKPGTLHGITKQERDEETIALLRSQVKGLLVVIGVAAAEVAAWSHHLPTPAECASVVSGLQMARQVVTDDPA